MIALCIFAKEPRPGAVKTRLARAIGAETAAALASALLLDTLDRVQAFPGDVWVAYAPADAGEAFRELLEESGCAPAFLMPQSEGDLGERLEHAVGRLMERGCRRVLLLGADSPTLPWSSLMALWEALETHRFALGPTPDGGFWGLGARAWQPGLLRGIPWSTDRTFAATRARLAAVGPVIQVPEWYDVDELPDLRRLRNDPALAYCPRTNRLVRSRWVAPHLDR
jgi:rSAM/selenodomain-associated transferase 1